MTQVVLNISSKKKWNALKAVLEDMNIDYTTQDAIEKLSEKEVDLLHRANDDKGNDRVTVYTNHREILGRGLSVPKQVFVHEEDCLTRD